MAVITALLQFIYTLILIIIAMFLCYFIVAMILALFGKPIRFKIK